MVNRIASARLPPVARRELANPEIARRSAKTMCKNRSSAGPKRSVNTDNPDEIGLLYKQTDSETQITRQINSMCKNHP
jgi:hypothetical protein